MHLRDYQQQVIDRVVVSWKKGHKRPCLVLSCGGGKSVITAHIAKVLTSKNKNVLFCIHRLELKNQIINTFKNWGVDMHHCNIEMVQGLKRKMPSLPYPHLIIFDEAHHMVAKTYKNIINQFPLALCLGVTATPIRQSGEGLDQVCDDLVIGVSTKWLIENGYLSNYKYFSIPVADFNNIKIVRGEYDLLQLSEIMENNRIYGDTVKNYIEKADGKKTIVYCCSVESAKQTALEFRKNGFKAESLDGKTNTKERLEVMEKFRTGEINILTNFILFGEGLDIPDCDCVILVRKVRSLALFIQMAMRCMRANSKDLNKIAIIIDQCGNVYEHGFPDDDRPWSLKGKIKNEQNSVKIKTCKGCYSVIPQNALKCNFCGADFTAEVAQRLQIEKVESELAELKKLEHEKLMSLSVNEINSLTTWGELAQVRVARGYKIMWQIRKAIELNIPIPANYEHLVDLIK